MNPSSLKMYIAVLDAVPDSMVPVLVAHATLGAHMEFSRPALEQQGTYIFNKCLYNTWLKTSFRKVVLKVNQKEFDKILGLAYVHTAHESSVLGAEKTCAVVCPREEYPKVLQFAKMWRPSTDAVADRLFIKVSMLEKRISDYEWRDSPGQGAY
jgi:peptidyl-tRNA hydrolase